MTATNDTAASAGVGGTRGRGGADGGGEDASGAATEGAAYRMDIYDRFAQMTSDIFKRIADGTAMVDVVDMIGDYCNAVDAVGDDDDVAAFIAARARAERLDQLQNVVDRVRAENARVPRGALPERIAAALTGATQ